MAYGLGMMRAPACQKRVGNILTLFVLREQDPRAPFTHHPPAETPSGAGFWGFSSLGDAAGLEAGWGCFGVLLLQAEMRARAWGWQHPTLESQNHSIAALRSCRA